MSKPDFEGLDRYQVTYKLKGGEKDWNFPFMCWAEGDDHAIEQCVNANPDAIWSEVRKLTKQERFEKAVEAAHLAFWSEVANNHYPEVESGDFGILETHEMDVWMKKFVKHWLWGNHPIEDYSDELEVR